MVGVFPVVLLSSGVLVLPVLFRFELATFWADSALFLSFQPVACVSGYE